ncbi:MAG TPA: DUF4185 domain-containing protein [Thermoanaerobaculia bacterium]|nr:DUF4185 domain-containing protein [Thermoanaerobaculia bacterium]
MLAPPRIQSVHFMGAAHAGGGAGWRLHGQDGGQSIALGEETLFVFSDTLLARSGAPLAKATPGAAHFLGNCAAVSREPTLDRALRTLRYFEEQGLPREILAPSPLERMAGHRFWPQHGIAAGESVYLFYLGIHQFESKSTWGFRATGSGLARFDPRRGVAERIVRDGEWRLWSGDGDLRLGTQVLREGEDVYVFGSRVSDGGTVAILARVPIAAIEDPDAYRFLASEEGAWSASVAEACALASTAPEFSVSFNAHLGAYLMVYVESFGRELFVRTAPHVRGPWGAPVSAGRLPHREQAEVVALAFEHPRFARNGGKTVVVSYCQPHFTQNSLVAITFA